MKLDFSITIIILSLIYSILVYYQISRYIKLHCTSYDRYLNNYRKLNKINNEERFVVIMNTTFDRINKIKPVINSLLDQTIKIDEIAINLYNKDNKQVNMDNIEPQIHKVVNIYKINNNGYDSEICNCLIPTLFREQDANTTVLVLRDNIIYGKNFIYRVLKESEKNTNNIIEINSENMYIVKPKFFKANSIDKKNVFNKNWFDNNITVPKTNINIKTKNYKLLK
jgi:hypothetical protein